MKKLRKFIQLMVLLAMTVVTCSACSKETKEESIKEDIIEVLKDTSEESVDNIEIELRDIDKEAKTDTIYCKIDSNDGEKEYTKYYVALYILDEKEGWIFKDVTPDKEEQWYSVPLIGVDESFIEESINGKTIIIDDEGWYLDEENIGNIQIIEQNTQLEQKKDFVTVTVEILSDVLIAKGEMDFEYTYNEGWYLENFQISKPFISEYQSGREPEFTDDELMKDMSSVPLCVGSEENSSEQTINVVPDEISDFVVVNKIASDKGTLQSYICTFTINKPIAKIVVEAVLNYRYDVINGWKMNDIAYSKTDICDVDLGELKGIWNGNMSEFALSYVMQAITLEITEASDDGTIMAKINVPSEGRSCIVKGNVDVTNLSFILNFEEWINKPNRNASIYEPRLYGIIMLENSTIECIKAMDTNNFEVVKTE